MAATGLPNAHSQCLLRMKFHFEVVVESFPYMDIALLTFSLKRLSTSLFILNFSESIDYLFWHAKCIPSQLFTCKSALRGTTFWVISIHDI